MLLLHGNGTKLSKNKLEMDSSVLPISFCGQQTWKKNTYFQTQVVIIFCNCCCCSLLICLINSNVSTLKQWHTKRKEKNCFSTVYTRRLDDRRSLMWLTIAFHTVQVRSLFVSFIFYLLLPFHFLLVQSVEFKAWSRLLACLCLCMCLCMCLSEDGCFSVYVGWCCCCVFFSFFLVFFFSHLVATAAAFFCPEFHVHRRCLLVYVNGWFCSFGSV